MDYSWFIEMPDCFKTKDLCEKVVGEEVDMFEYVPNEFKTKEMCERVVKLDVSRFLILYPEQFRNTSDV